ncbi:MAG: SMR family transporter [Patescibacteria group bacterium]
MQIFLMFALAVAGNALGTILIKFGTGKIAGINFSLESILAILKNFYILAGIIFYAASFPAYNYILQKLNVNVAFPIFTSASFAAVVIISFLFMKETLTILQLLGLILVTGGIVLLTTSGAR